MNSAVGEGWAKHEDNEKTRNYALNKTKHHPSLAGEIESLYKSNNAG